MATSYARVGMMFKNIFVGVFQGLLFLGHALLYGLQFTKMIRNVVRVAENESWLRSKVKSKIIVKMEHFLIGSTPSELHVLPTWSRRLVIIGKIKKVCSLHATAVKFMG